MNVFASLRFSLRAKLKTNSVETMSEVSQKSSVKIVTDVKRKTRSNGKAN